MAPEIPFVAWHEALDVNEDGLPIPEPAITDGEDDRRYSKAPDEEIDSDIPSRMDRAAVALEESEEDDERIVEEGEEDLGVTGVNEAAKLKVKTLVTGVSQSACEKDFVDVQNSRGEMQLTGARGRPSVQSLPP